MIGVPNGSTCSGDSGIEDWGIPITFCSPKVASQKNESNSTYSIMKNYQTSVGVSNFLEKKTNEAENEDIKIANTSFTMTGLSCFESKQKKDDNGSGQRNGNSVEIIVEKRKEDDPYISLLSSDDEDANLRQLSREVSVVAARSKDTTNSPHGDVSPHYQARSRRRRKFGFMDGNHNDSGLEKFPKERLFYSPGGGFDAINTGCFEG